MQAYTYKAYSASGCAAANLIATAAAFTTGGVSVSNLSETSRGVNVGVLAADLEANAFTTGDHEGGYKLDRVVIKFRDKVGAPGTFTAAIHAETGGIPAATATHTLSGDTTPTTAGDYAYTCSGTCRLDRNTTYFLHLSGTSTAYSIGYFSADSTLSDSETNTPSNAGWSIANRAKYKRQSWLDETSDFSLMFEVFAAENPVLSVSSVTSTTASLDITDHTGDWRYKADKAPHNACSAVQTGSSASLAGLTSGTKYVYKAYAAGGCTDANLLATAEFHHRRRVRWQYE